MTSASQFRVGPPPSLTSDLYAADFNEVKALGRKDSTVRTPEQTAIAQFWLAPGFKFNIDGAWYNLAVQAALAHPMSMLDDARMFAMVELVRQDALIAAEDSKYVYDFWRPITAIQNADQDGNPATEADPSWTPYQDTVPNPDYPSNAGVIGGTGAAILSGIYGDGMTITLQSGNAPDAPRTYPSFSAIGDEFGFARVLQGIHFPNSVKVGQATGRAVAHYILTNVMQPVQGGGDVNRDGRVDLKDVVLALQGAVGDVPLSSEQAAAADLDGSGTVDLKDVTSLLSKAIGL
jgi:hypothetical protein